MRGIRFAQRVFGRKLAREIEDTIEAYASLARRQRRELAEGLAKLGADDSSNIFLGTTAWEQAIELPLDKLAAHGLMLGASGAGKSYSALSIILQILNSASFPNSISFGILDAKGELFQLITNYLYAYLYRLAPAQRAAIAKKIIIIDFSNTEVIAPYNILAHREYLSDELMIADRIDTISEQFSGLSDMSVRMKMIAKYFFLLMAEFGLPLPLFERLCSNPALLTALVEKSKNKQVRSYFSNRFENENQSTLLALWQRLDSLQVSEGVRLSLSASSAPDFARLQDEGYIILVNTAGRNITRGSSELLQSFVLSDIEQSIFRRSNHDRKFLWFFDEAQNLFTTSANREHMVDLLTMARSFGSFFVMLTQSLSSAIRDSDILY